MYSYLCVGVGVLVRSILTGLAIGVGAVGTTSSDRFTPTCELVYSIPTCRAVGVGAVGTATTDQFTSICL